MFHINIIGRPYSKCPYQGEYCKQAFVAEGLTYVDAESAIVDVRRLYEAFPTVGWEVINCYTEESVFQLQPEVKFTLSNRNG